MASHRREDDRQSNRSWRFAPESARPETPIAFMTGRPKRARIDATRSGCLRAVQLQEGRARRRRSPPPGATSSASTVRTTFRARPATRRLSRAAASKATCRGLLSKNTKPTMSAPAASAASRLASVDRPQILTRSFITSSRRHMSAASDPVRANGGLSLVDRAFDRRATGRFEGLTRMQQRPDAIGGNDLRAQALRFAAQPIRLGARQDARPCGSCPA